MMPARSYQIPGGARVLVTTCDDCGADAPFGFNVNLLAALNATTPAEAKRHLGRWCCGLSADRKPKCKRISHASDDKVEPSDARLPHQESGYQGSLF